VRDWVVRFNAQGPAGLINGKAPGRRAILNEPQRAALQAIVEQGPIPAIHGVVRWRLVDLIQWLWEELRITLSPQTLSRELRVWAIASSRPARAIMPRTIKRRTLLKSAPGPLGGARTGGWQQANRDLVCRRGPGWTKEQDHAALGETRHAPRSPQGSANGLGLYLRRDLSG